jgi:hypothetical protein
MPDNYLAWLVGCGLFAMIMFTVGAVSDPDHTALTAVGIIGVMPLAFLIVLWGIHSARQD